MRKQVETLEHHADLAADGIEVLEIVVPVSYTHLRAHETVLDLVCRLLLEKKKHYTPHPDCLTADERTLLI